MRRGRSSLCDNIAKVHSIQGVLLSFSRMLKVWRHDGCFETCAPTNHIIRHPKLDMINTVRFTPIPCLVSRPNIILKCGRDSDGIAMEYLSHGGWTLEEACQSSPNFFYRDVLLAPNHTWRGSDATLIPPDVSLVSARSLCKLAAIDYVSRPLRFVVARFWSAFWVADALMLCVRFAVSYVLLQPLFCISIYRTGFAEGTFETGGTHYISM